MGTPKLTVVSDSGREVATPMPEGDRRRARRRRNKRLNVSRRVDYEFEGRKVFGYTKDIGSAGMFVRTSRTFEVGTIAEFLVSLDNQQEPITVQGEVVRLTTGAGDAGMGISFIDTGVRDILSNFVLDALLEKARRQLGSSGKNPRALREIGEILEEKRQTDEAILHYRTLLDVEPDAADVQARLGTMLVDVADQGENEDLIDEAVILLSAALNSGTEPEVAATLDRANRLQERLRQRRLKEENRRKESEAAEKRAVSERHNQNAQRAVELEHQAQALEAQKAALKIAQAKLQDANTQHEQRVRAEQAEHKQLRQQIESDRQGFEARALELAREAKDLQAQTEAVQAQQTAIKDAERRLENARAKLDQKREAWVQERKTLEQAHKEQEQAVQVQLAQLNDQRNELNTAQHALHEQRDAFEKAQHAYQQQHTKNAEEAQRERQALDEALEQLSQRETQVAALETAVAERQRHLESAQSRIATREQRLDEGKADVATREQLLVAQRMEIEKARASNKDQASVLRAKLETSQAHSQQLKADLVALQEQLQQAHETLAKQSQDSLAKQEALERLANTDVTQARQNLEAAQQRVNELDVELVAAAQRFENERYKQELEFDSEKKVLVERLQEVQGVADEREQGLQDYAGKLAAVTQTLKQRDEAAAKVEAALAQRTNAIKELSAQLAQRDTALQKSEATLAQHALETKKQEAHLAQLQTELAQQKKNLEQERNHKIEERDSALAKRAAELADQDKELQRRQTELAQREQEATKQSLQLGKRDSDLAARERAVLSTKDLEARLAAERDLRVRAETDHHTQRNRLEAQIGDYQRDLAAAKDAASKHADLDAKLRATLRELETLRAKHVESMRPTEVQPLDSVRPTTDFGNAQTVQTELPDMSSFAQPLTLPPAPTPRVQVSRPRLSVAWATETGQRSLAALRRARRTLPSRPDLLDRLRSVPKAVWIGLGTVAALTLVVLLGMAVSRDEVEPQNAAALAPRTSPTPAVASPIAEPTKAVIKEPVVAAVKQPTVHAAAPKNNTAQAAKPTNSPRSSANASRRSKAATEPSRSLASLFDDDGSAEKVEVSSATVRVAELTRAAQAKSHDVRKCLQAARQDNRLAAGAYPVVVSFAVTAGGDATQAKLVGPASVLAAGLGSCVAQAVGNWKFGKGAPVTLGRVNLGSLEAR